MLKLIIHGCAGKMGRNVAAAALEAGDVQIVAGVDKFLSGTFDFQAYQSIWEVPQNTSQNADVVIDFTRPDGLADLLAWARQHKTAAVIATTGLEAGHHALLAEAGHDISVLLAANLSIGVNLLQDLVQQAAGSLHGFDIEITETHHNQKVDAPSGTALALAEAARRGLAAPHDFVYGRHGVNRKRGPGEIGIHALRGGTVVGQHDVYFFGNEETVTLSHTS
ncbi:MAG: 4-hydroxy-tetrahydrodipicolinate reductase, partial [Clostridia bacterium]|nr:4-hydroxy-tetrahydrodipicolinate reductase [Clostridia bacterium]